jgi:hypothetical protein
MFEMTMTNELTDDPRKLRAMLSRISDLASQHSVPCVLVGIISEPTDTAFPDFIDYVASALRVEDGIFRMTRERIVIQLTDVSREAADVILERLQAGFEREFPMSASPSLQIRCYPVEGGEEILRVRDVLMRIFSVSMMH